MGARTDTVMNNWWKGMYGSGPTTYILGGSSFTAFSGTGRFFGISGISLGTNTRVRLIDGTAGATLVSIAEVGADIAYKDISFIPMRPIQVGTGLLVQVTSGTARFITFVETDI